VVIVCTGFFQQQIDQAEWWKDFTAHYKHAEVFVCEWTAGTFDFKIFTSGFNKVRSQQNKVGKTNAFSNISNPINTLMR